jgi:hypothetical protein
MTTNYNGLTRNTWTGTWSPTGDHPIVLDTEIRGSLQSISGDIGDQLTDITGQRLTEGMLVYVKNAYTADTVTRTGDSYYKFNLLAGESRDATTGQMPNTEANWTKFTASGQGSVEKLEDIGNVAAADPILNNSMLQYDADNSAWNTTTTVTGITLSSSSMDAGQF